MTDTTAPPVFPEWQIDTPVHEAVFEALGAASACWEHVDRAGVFDSERANLIGEELMSLLQCKLWTDNTESP